MGRQQGHELAELEALVVVDVVVGSADGAVFENVNLPVRDGHLAECRD